jgi:hypothetical protein
MRKNFMFVLLCLMVVAGCSYTDYGGRFAALEQRITLMEASGVGAATKMYGRDCIDSETDGCAKSMDDIPGTKETGDLCIILNSDKVMAMYRYNATSGAAVSYPNIIDDDTIAGNERWELYNGRIDGSIQFSVGDPENMPTHLGRSTKSKVVWYNNTGVTFRIQEIRAISDTNGYTFLLFKSNSSTDIGTANDTQIDSVTTDTVGTSGWYKVISSGFDSGAIESGKYLIFEHSSGTAEDVQVVIRGYLKT